MRLEHVNISVSDPKACAAMLERMFGWRTRWEGVAMNNGYTVHVGDEGSYLALYDFGGTMQEPGTSYETRGGLNHIGVVVDDLSAAEARIRAEGFETHSHADYEPGRRFYFDGPAGIEFEVVAYD